MKAAATALLIALIVAACGGGSGNAGSNPGNVPEPEPPPAPAPGTVGDGRLPLVVGWVRETYGLPGMATVVVLDGQVVEATAEGMRSMEGGPAVTIQDRWHLGSLTKAMTASLAGILVELSVLDWNTTPLDVWPELDAEMNPAFRDITLQQLLAHTAGLRNVSSAPTEYLDSAPGSLIDKRRRFAAELLSDAPIGPAGRESYSNSGYVIAGAMMETSMSTPWESLMQDYLFAALQMTSSGFGAPGDADTLSQPAGHWATSSGFDPVLPGPDADNPQVFGPAGTVHSSLGDYANFMLAHIAGARGIDGFVTAATFDVLHSPVDNGSALGWGVSTSDSDPDLVELGHAGSNLRWYAVVRLLPELEAGALFVTNAGGDTAAAGVAALEDLIAQRVADSL